MKGKILNTNYSKKTKLKLTEEEKIFYKTWDDRNKRLNDKYENLYINGNVLNKQIALTFDDAPDYKCTPLILDILKEYNVKATFSIIGVYIDENRELLKRIYDEGHKIINHTDKHLDMEKCTVEEIEKEVLDCEEKINNVLGIRTKVVRPPYGSVDDKSMTILNNLGYQTILWSFNTCDWVAECGDDILDGMAENVRNGEVILLHSYEAKEPTVEMLPNMITELREQGFEFITIDKMFNIDLYK